jgi:hypothetical protein
MLPSHPHALFGPLFGPLSGPRPQNLFGSGLALTLDDIYDAPAQRLLDPVLALVLSAVARVQPQVRKARKLPVRPPQERLDALIIHHFGTHELRLEDEAFRIYQQVRLSAFDLLTCVVTAIFSAYRSTLDLPWLSTTPALGLKDLLSGEP